MIQSTVDLSATSKNPNYMTVHTDFRRQKIKTCIMRGMDETR